MFEVASVLWPTYQALTNRTENSNHLASILASIFKRMVSIRGVDSTLGTGATILQHGIQKITRGHTLP